MSRFYISAVTLRALVKGFIRIRSTWNLFLKSSITFSVSLLCYVLSRLVLLSWPREVFVRMRTEPLLCHLLFSHEHYSSRLLDIYELWSFSLLSWWKRNLKLNLVNEGYWITI